MKFVLTLRVSSTDATGSAECLIIMLPAVAPFWVGKGSTKMPRYTELAGLLDRGDSDVQAYGVVESCCRRCVATTSSGCCNCAIVPRILRKLPGPLKLRLYVLLCDHLTCYGQRAKKKSENTGQEAQRAVMQDGNVMKCSGTGQHTITWGDQYQPSSHVHASFKTHYHLSIRPGRVVAYVPSCPQMPRQPPCLPL
jgi:hypothetical protein